MPIAQKSPLSFLSRESQQRVAAAVERGLSEVRRDAGKLFDRLQLRLRAWQESLDPSLADWASKARVETPVRSAEETRADLVRKIDQAQRAG